MKRYNITTVKTYTKNGEEKKQWMSVGSMVRFDATQEKPEGFVLELNMFPETKFFVFEQKPKDQQSYDGVDTPSPREQSHDSEDINPSDIPF